MTVLPPLISPPWSLTPFSCFKIFFASTHSILYLFLDDSTFPFSPDSHSSSQQLSLSFPFSSFAKQSPAVKFPKDPVRSPFRSFISVRSSRRNPSFFVVPYLHFPFPFVSLSRSKSNSHLSDSFHLWPKSKSEIRSFSLPVNNPVRSETSTRTYQ